MTSAKHQSNKDLVKKKGKHHLHNQHDHGNPKECIDTVLDRNKKKASWAAPFLASQHLADYIWLSNAQMLAAKLVGGSLPPNRLSN